MRSPCYYSPYVNGLSWHTNIAVIKICPPCWVICCRGLQFLTPLLAFQPTLLPMLAGTSSSTCPRLTTSLRRSAACAWPLSWASLLTPSAMPGSSCFPLCPAAPCQALLLLQLLQCYISVTVCKCCYILTQVLGTACAKKVTDFLQTDSERLGLATLLRVHGFEPTVYSSNLILTLPTMRSCLQFNLIT